MRGSSGYDLYRWRAKEEKWKERKGWKETGVSEKDPAVHQSRKTHGNRNRIRRYISACTVFLSGGAGSLERSQTFLYMRTSSFELLSRPPLCFFFLDDCCHRLHRWWFFGFCFSDPVCVQMGITFKAIDFTDEIFAVLSRSLESFCEHLLRLT